MNKQMGRILIGFLACAGISIIDARTISTPLPLYLGWPAAHVYYPVDDMKEPINECGTDFQIWGAGYYRSATDAYGPKTDTSCDPCVRNCSTETVNAAGICVSSKRESLGSLIFGSPSFTIAQSFANSAVGTAIPASPWTAISELTPDYKYRERGAFFGLILGKRFGCDDQWRAGIRFALPYRDIDLAETDCSDTVGDSLDDVIKRRAETISDPSLNPTSQTNPTTWAARWDLLSALDVIAFNATGGTTPLVNYGATPITIDTQDLTGALSSAQPPVLGNPSQPVVAVIRSVDGSAPASERWADLPANGATVLGADGSGLSELGRGRFVNNISYVPLSASVANQRQLWLVPNVNEDGSIDGAAPIISAILQASQYVDPDISTFLQAQGITFCNGSRKGIGDLDIQLYVGHHCDCGFGELQLAVRVPTGNKVRSALSTVAQPLGNNGHVEIRPGIVLGTSYFDWLKFKLDATYSFVLKKTEQLAAPFTGATIRNIGPSIPGKVSWGYFWGEIDMTIVNPCNPCMGATIAYQPYVKLRDKICFPCTETRDFIGNVQTLDATILTANTKRVAHTIRTELFYTGDCYNLFLGFAQVVGGHNITRDTDLYLGGFVTF